MDSLFETGSESIYGRGETVSSDLGTVHYIETGYVGMYSSIEDVRRLLFVYKKGDIFPFAVHSSVIAEREYSYIALSKLTIRTVPRKEFEKLIQDPRHFSPLFANLQEIIQLQFERIDNLQKGQILERLIERLLFFAKRVGVQKGDKIVFDVTMSHVDLASSIGTSRESVNRYMKQLESLGVLSVKRQRITIYSIDWLKAIMATKELPTHRNWSLLPATVVTAALAVDGVVKTLGNLS